MASNYLRLFLTFLIWGSNVVLGRYLSAYVPPFTLTALRFSIAGLIFLPFLIGKRIWPSRRQWVLLLGLAVSGTFAFNSLMYWGLHYTTAINAGLLNAFTPVLIMLLAALWLKEKVTLRQILGLTISLTGVLVIESMGNIGAITSLNFNIGNLIILVDGIIWACFSILGKIITRELPPLVVTGFSVLLGLPFLYLVSIMELRHGGQIIWSSGMIMGTLYLGIFASVLAFIWWYEALSKLGAVLVSLVFNSIPLFSVILAMIFLGESISWFHLGGGGMIISGILLASWPVSKRLNLISKSGGEANKLSQR